MAVIQLYQYANARQGEALLWLYNSSATAPDYAARSFPVARLARDWLGPCARCTPGAHVHKVGGNLVAVTACTWMCTYMQTAAPKSRLAWACGEAGRRRIAGEGHCAPAARAQVGSMGGGASRSLKRGDGVWQRGLPAALARLKAHLKTQTCVKRDLSALERWPTRPVSEGTWVGARHSIGGLAKPDLRALRRQAACRGPANV